MLGHVPDLQELDGAATGRVARHPPGNRQPAPARQGPPGRRWLPKALVVLADLVTVILALALAFAFLEFAPGSGRPSYGLRQYAILGAVAAPIWIASFFHYRLYSATHVSSPVEEFGRLVHAAFASLIVMTSLGFMLKFFVSRAWLGLSFVCAVALVGAERAIVRRVFRSLRRRGRMLRSAVIVGWNHEGKAISEMLEKDPALGYRVVGIVNDQAQSDGSSGDHPPVVGRVHEALEAVQRIGAGTVIVATTGIDFEVVNRLVRHLSEAGINVELSSSLRDIAAKRLTLRSLGRFPIAYVEPLQLHGWRSKAKRTFDVCVASVALLALALPLLVIALAIKLTSPKEPILFKQHRLGKDNSIFRMLKFRTMREWPEERMAAVEALNHASGPLFKARNDPRVTVLGRRLRRFSLDELPQLWNVVRGEMSLVGPRPAIPAEADFWTSELRHRLTVKPGITGMWQISGRADSTFEDYHRLDLFYVDNWSLWTDLAILAKTVPAVVSGRGAY